MFADAMRRSLATGLNSWHRMCRPARNSAPLWPRSPVFALSMLAIVVLVALLMEHLDAPLLVWALSVPMTLRALFEVVTQLGKSDWILVASGVLAIALSVLRWGDLARRQRVRLAAWHADATFIFLTVAISGTTISLIKNTIGRGRPKFFAEHGQLYFDFAAFQSQFASFPSGHSTTFGALAAGLALLDRRRAWLWLSFGFLGGLSRTMVGAHYPSDVVAGLACGAVFTLLAARYLAQRGLMFTLSPGAIIPRRKR